MSTILADWHNQRWPNTDERTIAAKLAEECGEVCGAIIKHAEHRTTEQDILDELGDLLIVTAVLAGRHNQTIQQLLADRLRTVAARP